MSARGTAGLRPTTLSILRSARPAHRSEHVAAENKCSEVAHRPRRVIIVDARLPTTFTDHVTEVPGWEEPLEELRAALPSGSSRRWWGPAPKPSTDIEKPATRTLGIISSFERMENHHRFISSALQVLIQADAIAPPGRQSLERAWQTSRRFLESAIRDDAVA